jgi:heme A synthase
LELILGFVLPWALVAAVGLRRDRLTHWRFYVAPALVGALAALGVLTTDSGATPDLWVGVSASLAAIAGAALVLIIQSLLPLDWWVRPDEPPRRDA